MQNFIEIYPPGVVAGDSVGVEVDGTFGVVVPDEVDAPVGVAVGTALELSVTITGFFDVKPSGHLRFAAITFCFTFPFSL